MLKNLRHDEDVIMIARQYPLTRFKHFFLAFLLLFVPFFFVVPLFRWGTPGKVIFFIAVILGLIVLIRAFVMWYFATVILTSERLVNIGQEGFFDRTVSEIELGNIQHSSYEHKGITQTVLRFGSLQIQTYSGAALSFDGIAQPHVLHHALVEARRYVKAENIV